MTINIHDYVDRYLNDYVFYHWQHFNEEADMSRYLFEGKYHEVIQDLEFAALGPMAQASMFNSSDKTGAAASLDVADEIANGTLLEQSLEEIAAGLNSAIDYHANTNDIMTLYREALTYANMLEGGVPQVNTVKRFLTLLTSALDLAGGYNASTLSAIRNFGRGITGKQIRFNPGNVQVVSESQLTELFNIQDALARANQKFSESGQTLSAASFRSTIVYIFKRVIMQKLAQSMLSDTVQEGLSQVDDILLALGFKLEQPKTKKPNSSAQKMDIINTKGLQLDVKKSGTTATIEIGTDMQVQFVNLDQGGDINIIAKSTIGDLYATGSPIRYYAVNLIAHRNDFIEEYESMIASTAACFVRDSMLGGANKKYTSQFILVNGKIYSVLRIIKNICDTYLTGAFVSRGVQIQELNRGANAWQRDEETNGPNIRLAVLRSNLVNEVINKLTISLHYNKNLISQYAF